MISKKVIASNYAEAIFSLLGDVKQEFKACSVLIRENNDFFKNPVINIEDKVKCLDEKLSAAFRVIIKKGHLDLLESIYDFLRKLVDKSKGAVYFKIESAFNDEDRIVELLEKKFGNIVYTFRVNKELLSGYRLKFEDKLIEFSIAKDLDNLGKINF
tara:strand:- start:6576 stop:7046 length:471 start_codon:yes stop_codon:yes gene_type:complete